VDADADAGGDAGAPELFEQLDEIDFALRPFGQPPELREFLREPFEAIGFRGQHLDRRSDRPAVRPPGRSS